MYEKDSHFAAPRLRRAISLLSLLLPLLFLPPLALTPRIMMTFYFTDYLNYISAIRNAYKLSIYMIEEIHHDVK